MPIVIRCLASVVAVVLFSTPLLGEEKVFVSDIQNKIRTLQEAGLSDPLQSTIDAFEALTASRAWQNKFGGQAIGQLVEFDDKVSRFQTAEGAAGEPFVDFEIKLLAPKSKGDVRKAKTHSEGIVKFYSDNEAQIQPAIFAKKYGINLTKLPRGFADCVEVSDSDALILVQLQDLTTSHIKELGKTLSRRFIILKGNAAESLDESIAAAFASTGKSLVIVPNPSKLQPGHSGPTPSVVKSLSTTAADLAFPALTHLSNDFAQAVADHTGLLALDGVRTIEAGAGRHLSNHKGQLGLCTTLQDRIVLHDTITEDDWDALAGSPSLKVAFGKINDEVSRRKAVAAEIENKIAALGGRPQATLGSLKLGESIDDIRKQFPPDQTYVVDPFSDQKSITNAPEWMLITPSNPFFEVKKWAGDDTSTPLVARFTHSLLWDGFTESTRQSTTPGVKYVYAYGGPPEMQGIWWIRFECHPDFGCIAILIQYRKDVPFNSIRQVLDEKFGKGEMPSMITRDETVREIKVRAGEVEIGPEEQSTELVNMGAYYEWRPEKGVEIRCGGSLDTPTVNLWWKSAIEAHVAAVREARDNMKKAKEEAAGVKLGL